MDKGDLVKIGDVAKMFHISVGILRYYEKTGLVKPEYIDNNTGYRYYSTRQFEVLSTIRALRALDMPLEQISDFLHNRDIDKMKKMLEDQRNIVVQKQRKLKIIEDKIERRIKLIEDAVSSEIGNIKIKQIPAQRVAWLRNRLYLNSYLDLENSIRKLEKDENEAIAWLGKVGVGIAKEKLNNEKYNEYDMVFLILDKDDEYVGKTEVWKEETCVSIRFCGSHKDAPEQYKKLMKFIIEHRMSVCGFSREITMIDNGMTNDEEKFITEIQIPIKF